MNSKSIYIHPTAIIDQDVHISSGVRIWHFSHVRSQARIMRDVSLARDVYIDVGVQVGRASRIQNGVSVYQGVNIGDYCFVGPHVIFTNDMYPRVGSKNWKIVSTELHVGCSIGAGTMIRCGISIGAFAMIGTGSLVTKSIKPFRLAHGAPAKEQAQICACGQTQAPLGKRFNPLRDCCKRNLINEVYRAAAAQVN